MTYLFLLVLLIALLIGIPVAFAVLASGIVGAAMSTGVKWASIFTSSLNGINSATMMAVPLFLLAGKLMNGGGITNRLFNFADKLVGWLPGGLGHVNILSSFIFAGMSGSSVADLGCLGAVELKAMREHGYDDEFSCGITTTSSVLGPLVPPSVPLIIYGITTNVSVGALFLAGVLPGVMLVVLMMAMVAIFTIIKHYPRGERVSIQEFFRIMKGAILPLLGPVIILVCIYTGICTPTESAAILVIYTGFLAIVVYQEVNLKDIHQMLIETIEDTAVITLIISFATYFGSVLIRTRIPQKIAEVIGMIVTSKAMLFILLTIFLLAIGMFLEGITAITILVPILAPLAEIWGISGVQFGIMFQVALSIGGLTPPFGILMFVMSKISGVPVDRLAKAYIPWIIMLIAGVILIAAFPWLSEWLPSAAGYNIAFN